MYAIRIQFPRRLEEGGDNQVHPFTEEEFNQVWRILQSTTPYEVLMLDEGATTIQIHDAYWALFPQIARLYATTPGAWRALCALRTAREQLLSRKLTYRIHLAIREIYLHETVWNIVNMPLRRKLKYLLTLALLIVLLIQMWNFFGPNKTDISVKTTVHENTEYAVLDNPRMPEAFQTSDSKSLWIHLCEVCNQEIKHRVQKMFLADLLGSDSLKQEAVQSKMPICELLEEYTAGKGYKHHKEDL